MKKTAAIVCLTAALTGCVSNVEPTASQHTTEDVNVAGAERVSVSSVSISSGERWRMTCQGGQGAMRVPIFARVANFDHATGRIDLIVTDRDGYDGTSTATMSGNRIYMFDVSGTWAENGRTALLPVPDLCPNGMLIERI